MRRKEIMHGCTRKTAKVKAVLNNITHYFNKYDNEIEWAESQTVPVITYVRSNNKWLPELDF